MQAPKSVLIAQHNEQFTKENELKQFVELTARGEPFDRSMLLIFMLNEMN